MPLSMTFFPCALSKLIEVGFSALSRYANWIRRNKEQRDVLQCDLDDREATLREHPDFDEVHDDDPSVISKWKLIQIGTLAGILLWRETTAGLDQMRSCLARETVERESLFFKAGLTVGTLRIPGIIHSSILRYLSPIETNG
jgi:hypothetical protein